MRFYGIHHRLISVEVVDHDQTYMLAAHNTASALLTRHRSKDVSRLPKIFVLASTLRGYACLMMIKRVQGLMVSKPCPGSKSIRLMYVLRHHGPRLKSPFQGPS
jgi:hypothetical protein